MKIRQRRWAQAWVPVLGAVSCALVFSWSPVEGQRESPNSAVAEAAIGQLRSPYCPGLMLDVCPSAPAAALRDSIYDLAAEGYSSEALVEWMLARHGEEWRGVPQGSGIGLWAWIIPPLALLVGLGAVVGWLRANRREIPVTAPATGIPMPPADRGRVEAAMREWEEAGEEDV